MNKIALAVVALSIVAAAATAIVFTPVQDAMVALSVSITAKAHTLVLV
jgi:hypothetical protein